jgi:hypothetical protein
MLNGAPREPAAGVVRVVFAGADVLRLVADARSRRLSDVLFCHDSGAYLCLEVGPLIVRPVDGGLPEGVGPDWVERVPVDFLATIRSAERLVFLVDESVHPVHIGYRIEA